MQPEQLNVTSSTKDGKTGKRFSMRRNGGAGQAYAGISSRLDLKLAILLGLIAFLAYANTLKNGFTMDDTVMIVKNTLVTKGISSVPEILSTAHQYGYWHIPNDEYRPLSLVLFSIEYQFFELNPLPYHFFNILLFAGCVILLFRFLIQFFDGRKSGVAFIAALLFALHPIHTEVVANIKSGDEQLCFIFAFLSLNIFSRYMHEGKAIQIAAGTLCLFFSFLSKETVITFLVIIPAFFLLNRSENRKRSSYITISTILVAIVFIAIRFAVLNYYHANNLTKISVVENMLSDPGLSVASRAATTIFILGSYIKLLFFPYPLICDYSYSSIPYAHLAFLVIGSLLK